MIFNKAHVAIAIHRLGEYHITVALRILYTQTVGTQISRRIVWCLIWVCSVCLCPTKMTLRLYVWACIISILAFMG